MSHFIRELSKQSRWRRSYEGFRLPCLYLCLYLRLYLCLYICLYICLYLCLYICLVFVFTFALNVSLHLSLSLSCCLVSPCLLLSSSLSLPLLSCLVSIHLVLPCLMEARQSKTTLTLRVLGLFLTCKSRVFCCLCLLALASLLIVVTCLYLSCLSFLEEVVMEKFAFIRHSTSIRYIHFLCFA
jgi:hypothetical protein